MTKSEILEAIRSAKDAYIENRARQNDYGMCFYLGRALGIPSEYHLLDTYIPELEDMKPSSTLGPWDYWWPVEDPKPRIETFNKLIKIYES